MIEDPGSHRGREENAEGSSDPKQEKVIRLRTNEVLRLLEREGLIKRLPPDKKKVRDAIALAHRDLRTSRTILSTDHDWAYTIAYNAVLQAGRALMFLKRVPPERCKPAYLRSKIR